MMLKDVRGIAYTELELNPWIKERKKRRKRRSN